MEINGLKMDGFKGGINTWELAFCFLIMKTITSQVGLDLLEMMPHTAVLTNYWCPAWLLQANAVGGGG